jgi:hypothetical protein
LYIDSRFRGIDNKAVKTLGRWYNIRIISVRIKVNRSLQLCPRGSGYGSGHSDAPLTSHRLSGCQCARQTAAGNRIRRSVEAAAAKDYKILELDASYR